jgi:hypothetical protein
VEVVIQMHGYNFGRDPEGRKVQYRYTVRIRRSNFKCVSRVPIMAAVRFGVSGETAMSRLSPMIRRDYEKLVQMFGKPTSSCIWK